MEFCEIYTYLECIFVCVYVLFKYAMWQISEKGRLCPIYKLEEIRSTDLRVTAAEVGCVTESYLVWAHSG